MLAGWMQSLYEDATAVNRENILDAVDHRGGRLLDLGCDDGAWTLEVATRMRADEVHGVEIVPERARAAAERGVRVHVGDLAGALPFDDATFDVVHANQVIEHVPDVDRFAAEVSRVLKPGGLAVISTENASSWHNVAAQALGWQMFSLTNMSSRAAGIGNPFALHRRGDGVATSWTHKTIFSYLGLVEFLRAHGLVDVVVHGAGYYPLPARVGRLEARHAHFLTATARKP